MKLSIITINLNNKEGLQKTIDSVVCQTFKDYEWIVIDGGSTDGSKELIEQYAAHFSYWVSEPDKGIYNAMNKGIRAAKGEYCLFLNSGDRLAHNNAVERVFLCSDSEDTIVGNQYLEIGDKLIPSEITIHRIKNGLVYGMDLLFGSLPHQSSFIKRDLFDRYGLYDEDYKLVSDWKFSIETVLINKISVKLLYDVYVSIFDTSGISRFTNGLLGKEIESVKKELIPQAILDDYERYVYPEYIMRKFFLFRVLRLLLYKTALCYHNLIKKINRYDCS